MARSILVDDYRTSEEYTRHIAATKTEKEKRIALYADRYEQGLGIFNGEPLPASDRQLPKE